MPSDSGLAVRLGPAQTIAWASTYYLPAVTAEAMAGDLGVPTSAVFAGLSLALLVAALIGPGAGAAIDRWGGRQVLAATNLINAAGLLLLALSQGPVGLFAAWGLLGIAMGAGLYEAAFAAIVRLRGAESRRAITGVTLLAGFASTVGWPLTDWFCSFAGWRGACLGWAFLHLAVALPLHLLLPPCSAPCWSARPRSPPACSSSACSAACIPCCRPAWPAWRIRSGAPSSWSSAPRPAPSSACCMGPATAC